MTARALIAVALLAVFVLARYGHARRRRGLQRDVGPGPDLPARLLDAVERLHEERHGG